MNDNTELQKPDWEYWRERGIAKLPECVLLSLNIEPRQRFAGHFNGQSPGAFDELDSFVKNEIRTGLDAYERGLGDKFADRLSMAEVQIAKGVKTWR